MFIFSLANVLHQSLEPEDAAKVLFLHFYSILGYRVNDYLLFFVITDQLSFLDQFNLVHRSAIFLSFNTKDPMPMT